MAGMILAVLYGIGSVAKWVGHTATIITKELIELARWIFDKMFDIYRHVYGMSPKIIIFLTFLFFISVFGGIVSFFMGFYFYCDTGDLYQANSIPAALTIFTTEIGYKLADKNLTESSILAQDLNLQNGDYYCDGSGSLTQAFCLTTRADTEEQCDQLPGCSWFWGSCQGIVNLVSLPDVGQFGKDCEDLNQTLCSFIVGCSWSEYEGFEYNELYSDNAHVIQYYDSDTVRGIMQVQCNDEKARLTVWGIDMFDPELYMLMAFLVLAIQLMMFFKANH